MSMIQNFNLAVAVFNIKKMLHRKILPKNALIVQKKQSMIWKSTPFRSGCLHLGLYSVKSRDD